VLRCYQALLILQSSCVFCLQTVDAERMKVNNNGESLQSDSGIIIGIQLPIIF
jgi:hypothetical protein